jgi:glycosyltransferase involved in cell wall biosynthesis
MLSTVIGAYSEQKALAPVVERCLAERGRIVSETAVEVVVVDDESGDRTAGAARAARPGRSGQTGR